jgi:oligosaccharide repeat unit polymerase
MFGRSIWLLLAIWGIYALSAIITNGSILYADIKTELLIITFIISIALGSIINSIFYVDQRNTNTFVVSHLGNKLFMYSIYASAFISLLVIIRYWTYLFIFNIDLSRAQLYSPVPSDGIFIASLYVGILYIKGVCSTVVSFTFLRSLLNGNSSFVIISGVAMILDAIAFTAKGPIINLLFCCLLFLLFNRNINFKKFLKLIIMIIIFTILLLFIELFRGNNIVESISRYFSIGPALLSSIVSGGFRGEYHSWFPNNMLLIFSGLDYLVIITIRGLIGLPITSVGYDWIKYIDIPQVVYADSNKFLPFNTFYTMLSEPYLAFGWAGIIGFGVLFGWLISNFEGKYFISGCERNLFWLQFLLGIVFFGVFVSAFSTVIFWLVLIFMYFFSRFIFEIKN